MTPEDDFYGPADAEEYGESIAPPALALAVYDHLAERQLVECSTYCVLCAEYRSVRAELEVL
jgi:hypothetical protein